MGEEGPGHQRGESENWIRNAVRRDLGEPAEEKTEDYHREKRLNDGPGGAQRRLFVPDLYVAPDEEVQKLAVLPQFTQLQRYPSMRRLNAKDRQVSSG